MIRTINSAICDRCKCEIIHDYNNQHINQLEISEIPLCSESLKGITSYLEGK